MGGALHFIQQTRFLSKNQGSTADAGQENTFRF